MPIRIPAEQVQNLQQIEAYVSGPDTANRLLTISAQFDVGFYVNGQANNYTQATNTYSVLVGPVLTNRQFYKAAASGSFTKIGFNSQVIPFNPNWSINSIDADWDDESGQVDLKIEVSLQSFGVNNLTQVIGLNFHATILYQAPQ